MYSVPQRSKQLKRKRSRWPEVHLFRTCSFLVVFVLACSLPIQAKGTVRVQQTDGSTQEYRDSAIVYAKDDKTLTITSADGKGTLKIEKAACSYAGQLWRCLVTNMSYTQNGASHPLDFETGTVYANTTQERQTIPLSSQQLPPGGIVMALKTKIGTYISLTGTIDSGLK